MKRLALVVLLLLAFAASLMAAEDEPKYYVFMNGSLLIKVADAKEIEAWMNVTLKEARKSIPSLGSLRWSLNYADFAKRHPGRRVLNRDLPLDEDRAYFMLTTSEAIKVADATALLATLEGVRKQPGVLALEAIRLDLCAKPWR